MGPVSRSILIITTSLQCLVPSWRSWARDDIHIQTQETEHLLLALLLCAVPASCSPFALYNTDVLAGAFIRMQKLWGEDSKKTESSLVEKFLEPLADRYCFVSRAAGCRATEQRAGSWWGGACCSFPDPAACRLPTCRCICCAIGEASTPVFPPFCILHVLVVCCDFTIVQGPRSPAPLFPFLHSSHTGCML